MDNRLTVKALWICEAKELFQFTFLKLAPEDKQEKEKNPLVIQWKRNILQLYKKEDFVQDF